MSKLWNEWELRIMVLVSLFLQIVLILLGNRRKHTANNWLQFILWFTYLSADWVATVALGILSNDSEDDKDDRKDPSQNSNFIIMASWAPFLLVHLGGPDNITAYSLEDNELWLRHLLGLIVQLSVAVYVFLRSWDDKSLNFLTIPVFVAAIIKYGERTWALRHGSSKHFRESILPPPDPGPNYAKFMDEYSSRKAQGYEVSVGTVIETTTPMVLNHSQGEIRNESIPDALSLHDGFNFFRIFKILFADLILSFQDHKNSQYFFQNKSWGYAFQVIEVELGLMYDMLYTKAVLTYSRLGLFLKAVSFSSTLSAFITFCYLIVIDKAYSEIDKCISFVLFSGAIALEIYAVIILLSSDWAMLWLSKHKNWRVDLLYKSISCLQKWFRLSHTKRGSNLMSQFNLISFCLKDKPVKCIQIQKQLLIYELLEKHHYQHSETVPEELKTLIFEQLLDKSRRAVDIEACKQLCAHRGDRVLEKWNCHASDAIDWSIKVEFDQSILLWHIATHLCFHSDASNNSECVNHQSCKTSMLLSNYMLHLLVMCTFMLPNGIGQIRFQDTCAEAIELFQERKYISERNQACKVLLRVNTEIPPSEVKGDRSKSVLFDACRLAKSLQSLEETELNWSKEKKWEMMSHVWVEMLSHAASQCRWVHHAKQLRKGGEFLTHVWLLMAHLGITEQFQISRGHARAKLLVS
ncbi:DUF594 family protein [Senna tora]|uniref:DUF594 family protein n=1 Tax=Senna tora TaxID=362788 RepID=A0A834SWT5_9FABA|nr:DUF594 family protein [Senna tora]